MIEKVLDIVSKVVSLEFRTDEGRTNFVSVLLVFALVYLGSRSDLGYMTILFMVFILLSLSVVGFWDVMRSVHGQRRSRYKERRRKSGGR